MGKSGFTLILLVVAPASWLWLAEPIVESCCAAPTDPVIPETVALQLIDIADEFSSANPSLDETWRTSLLECYEISTSFQSAQYGTTLRMNCNKFTHYYDRNEEDGK